MKVRIIIGPNGSGKTTFFRVLKEDLKLKMGIFINADEIEKDLTKKGSFAFDVTSFIIDEGDFKKFLFNHSLRKRYMLKNPEDNFSVNKNVIQIKGVKPNSYICAAIADYLREQCFFHNEKFSFESVFSDKRKLNFVRRMYKKGYKIYLYVISTVSPSINIARVNLRIKQKGHPVSEEKIISRFYKSISNIKTALPYSQRAYIIDNSQEFSPVLVAELENGNEITYLNKEYQPNWVKNII